MQPFPIELEPPEADRALETLAAGTDTDVMVGALYSSAVQQPQQPVLPYRAPRRTRRGLYDRPRPFRLELRIRRSLRSLDFKRVTTRYVEHRGQRLQRG
jgi:hypothetical protein